MVYAPSRGREGRGASTRRDEESRAPPRIDELNVPHLMRLGRPPKNRRGEGTPVRRSKLLALTHGERCARSFLLTGSGGLLYRDRTNVR